jgi:hypothetical protein
MGLPSEKLERLSDSTLVDQVFVDTEDMVPIVLQFPPQIVAKITWTVHTERFLTTAGDAEKGGDLPHLQPRMGWNQVPMTKNHVNEIGKVYCDKHGYPLPEQPPQTLEPLVQTIEVPLDVPLTTAFGRLTPIRPTKSDGAIFGPNSEHNSRLSVANATIAAIKGGLALHFRRQVNEVTREYRDAVNAIPKLPQHQGPTGCLDRWCQYREADTWGHVIGDCWGILTQRNPCLAGCHVGWRIFKKLICFDRLTHCCGPQNSRDQTLIINPCTCSCFFKQKGRVGTRKLFRKRTDPITNEVINGQANYDQEIRNELDARYDAAINHLRNELKFALAKLSRPAADATWEAKENFESFIIMMAQLKHIYSDYSNAGSRSGEKYPSQSTQGSVSDQIWQACVAGVRTNFQPVKIDLTPIDTSLCSSFAKSIGSERFIDAANGTIFEREQQMMADLQHELKGKYRAFNDRMQGITTTRTAENETEQVAKLLQQVKENGDGGSERRVVGVRDETWHNATHGLTKRTPNWLKVRRISLAETGAHIHREHEAERASLKPGILYPKLGEADGDDGGDGSVATAPPRKSFVNHGVPRGWTKHDGDGQTYYTNVHTGETTFNMPQLPAAPQGWITRPSSKHGHYYKNSITGDKTWDHPHDESGQWTRHFSPEQQQFCWENDDTNEVLWSPPAGWVEPNLRDGWKEIFDEKSQQVYYTQPSTGEVTWERPT